MIILFWSEVQYIFDEDIFLCWFLFYLFSPMSAVFYTNISQLFDEVKWW